MAKGKYSSKKNNLPQNNSGNTNAISKEPYSSSRNREKNNFTDNSLVDKTLKNAAKAPGLAGLAGKAANSKIGRNLINRGKEALDNNKTIAGARNTINNIKNFTDFVTGKKPHPLSYGPLKKQEEEKKKEEEEKKKEEEETVKQKETEEKETKKELELKIKVRKIIISVALTLLPMLIVLLIIIGSISAIASSKTNDAIAARVYGQEGKYQDYKFDDPKAEAFYKRANDIKKELISQKKNNPNGVEFTAAFYYIIANSTVMKDNYEYTDFTNADIKEIQEAAFDENNVASQDTFKKNIAEKVLRKYMKEYDEEEANLIAESIIKHIEETREILGEKETCVTGGSCSYNIAGIANGASTDTGFTMSNVKVRLMQCGTAGGARYGSGNWDNAAEEELVPFEKYVLGVAYAEIGEAPTEAFKAQLIAARNYSIARVHAMAGNLGKKIEKTGDGYILQLANCVADQVYCDPDKGCVKLNDGEQGGQTRSGTSTSYPGSKIYKQPLPANSPLREAAKAVEGELLIDENNAVINTPYASLIQNSFSSKAASGQDYKQILLSTYSQATKLSKGTCNGDSQTKCGTGGLASVGDFVNWKQYEGPWIGIPLGPSSFTVKSAGCTVTSTTMMFAKAIANKELTVSDTFKQMMGTDEIRPDTLVPYLNKTGGFTGGGLLNWGAVASAFSPQPRYAGQKTIPASCKNAACISQMLANELSGGRTIIIMNVSPAPNGGYGTMSHWVAVDYVKDGQVFIIDPGFGPKGAFDVLTSPIYGPQRLDLYAIYKY